MDQDALYKWHLARDFAFAKIHAVQQISGWFSALAEEIACRPLGSVRLPRAEESAMSFVAWHILRRLPKPLLLVGIVFVLVSAAKA